MSSVPENEYSRTLRAPGGAAPGVMAYLAERAVVEALRHGWRFLRDNPEQLVNVMRFADDTERASAQSLFTRAGGQYLDPQRISVGYPTIDSSSPQIAVMVESQHPVEHGEFIGDLIEPGVFDGVETIGGEDQGTQRGSIRERVVAIMMAAPNPDTVAYLDGIVDAIMYALRQWFMTPAEFDGAGLVSIDQGEKTAVDVDPRSDSSGNRLWLMTARWKIRGFVGTSLAIPPPMNRIVVAPVGSSVAGIAGQVSVRVR